SHPPPRGRPEKGDPPGPQPRGRTGSDRTGRFSRASWFRNFPSEPSSREFGAGPLLSQSGLHWNQKRKKPGGRSENPEEFGIRGCGGGRRKPPSPGLRAQAADEALPFLVEALHV